MHRSQAGKLLDQELRARMADLGFNGEKALFNKKFNDETTLWVSLQVLRDRQSFLGLFPRVGFINWKVADFMQRYLADALINPPVNIPPTLSATLGYLMPKPHQVEWYFECTEASIRSAAADIIQSVRSYGMSFTTRFPDVRSLSAWAKNPEIEPAAMFYQPQLLRAVILYLAGDWVQAKEIVEAQLSKGIVAGEINDPNYAPIIRLGHLLGAPEQDILSH